MLLSSLVLLPSLVFLSLVPFNLLVAPFNLLVVPFNLLVFDVVAFNFLLGDFLLVLDVVSSPLNLLVLDVVSSPLNLLVTVLDVVVLDVVVPIVPSPPLVPASPILISSTWYHLANRNTLQCLYNKKQYLLWRSFVTPPATSLLSATMTSCRKL